jgi:hypothetical protein
MNALFGTVLERTYFSNNPHKSKEEINVANARI